MTNAFTTRLAAIACTIVLSATLLAGAIGPAQADAGRDTARIVRTIA